MYTLHYIPTTFLLSHMSYYCLNLSRYLSKYCPFQSIFQPVNFVKTNLINGVAPLLGKLLMISKMLPFS